ncbi:Uncharacterised protein [Enterobacter hormaechei]|nr:Uncharacterised protein [Enterobacter cloacae]SAI31556.1 Uncharacterised protein [Enterobacter hormaechei]SAI59521.1 Uncharacterised protein [Enterobacter hormaechei]
MFLTQRLDREFIKQVNTGGKDPFLTVQRYNHAVLQRRIDGHTNFLNLRQLFTQLSGGHHQLAKGEARFTVAELRDGQPDRLSQFRAGYFSVQLRCRNAPGRRRLFGAGLYRLTQCVSRLCYSLTGLALPFCGLSRCIDALFCPGRRLQRSQLRPGRNRLSLVISLRLRRGLTKTCITRHHALLIRLQVKSLLLHLAQPAFHQAHPRRVDFRPAGVFGGHIPAAQRGFSPHGTLNFPAPGGIFVPDVFRNALNLPHAMLAYFFHFMAERFNPLTQRAAINFPKRDLMLHDGFDKARVMDIVRGQGFPFARILRHVGNQEMGVQLRVKIT